MRRARDVALRAGFYLAAALSGFAAAYVLREVRLPIPPSHPRSSPYKWGHHLWDTRNPQRALSDRDTPKPSLDPESSTTDEAPPPVTEHDTHHDPHTPTKTLPPLRTHSLPPPLPNAHALLSGSFVSISPDTSSTSSGEGGVDGESAARTNTSDSDSFVDILSPAPTHVISRRRSMRAHDLFAESHISFAELGSLVAQPE